MGGHTEASPVVCVHGATGHGGPAFSSGLRRSAGRAASVFAVDLRGHGRSGWQSPWTIKTHVGFLLETLDALGLRQPDWVGHSFGGRLVIEVAAKTPGCIRRAVLLDPAIQLPARVVDRAVVWGCASRSGSPFLPASRAATTRQFRANGAHSLTFNHFQLDSLPDGRLRRRTSQEAGPRDLSRACDDTRRYRE